MNRRLFQFLYSAIPMLTMVNVGFTVDGSGNIYDTGQGFGTLVSSVDHVSTGVYQINLVDQLNAAEGFNCQMMGSPGAPSGVQCEVVQTTAGNIRSNPASFQVQCFNSSGVLTDPAPYSSCSIILLARNSSAKY